MEDSQPQSVAPPSNPPPSTQPLTGGASGGGHGGPVAFITPDFGILVDVSSREMAL